MTVAGETAGRAGGKPWSVSPHSHTFPALDGARGLAVCLVLMVHAAEGLKSQIGPGPTRDLLVDLAPVVSLGGTGVHLFFVLSGFLLFLPFARALLGDGHRPDTANFYRRRLLRILPAYYVALVFVYVVFERSTTVDPVRQFVSHLLLVHNYSTVTYKGLDSPTWTMATEAQFYLLLPLIGAAAIWLLSRSSRALVVGAVAMVAVGPVAVAVSVVAAHVWPESSGYSTALSALYFMPTFGFGVLAAVFHVSVRSGRVPPARARLVAGLGLGLCTLIIAGLVLRELAHVQTPDLDYYFFATLMGLCYGGLIVGIATTPESRVARVLSAPAPRFTGDISYSVYLLHQPVLLGWIIPFAVGFGGLMPVVVTLIGVVVVIGPMALASFWFVERPFLRKKVRHHDTART